MHTKALFLIQLAILSIALVAAAFRPDLGRSLDLRWSVAAARVKPRMTPLLVGLLAFAGSLAVSLFVRFPHPWIQDGFSYLLAADTFSSGRLANPTHELWPFFDTFHVLQKPTYASKYPPGQGLLLALGQLIGGHPIVGVWLGVGLACASICWMLQAFVSHRWALLGGVLAAINFGFFSPWTQTYVVHALSATGGALVFGGFRRLGRESRATHGLPIGAGLLILAVTRPFEGLVLSIPFVALLAVWLVRARRGPERSALGSAVAVIAMILAVGAAGQAHYNWKVTGSHTRMPYTEYQSQYGGAPVFLWASPRTAPEYTDEAFRIHQVGWAIPHYEAQRTLEGYMAAKPRELIEAFAFLLQFSFWIPILVLLSFRRNPWERFVVLSVAVVTLAVLGLTWSTARKLAPLAGPLILLAVLGLRRIRLWSPGGRRVGRVVAIAVVLATVVSIPLGLVPWIQAPPKAMAIERAHVLQELERRGGRHLVMVRYGPKHDIHEEWVYNRADIDGSTVVWAREKTPPENQRLLAYFSDRTVWILESNGSPARLRPYTPGVDNK